MLSTLKPWVVRLEACVRVSVVLSHCVGARLFESRVLFLFCTNRGATKKCRQFLHTALFESSVLFLDLHHSQVQQGSVLCYTQSCSSLVPCFLFCTRGCNKEGYIVSRHRVARVCAKRVETGTVDARTVERCEQTVRVVTIDAAL